MEPDGPGQTLMDQNWSGTDMDIGQTQIDLEFHYVARSFVLFIYLFATNTWILGNLQSEYIQDSLNGFYKGWINKICNNYLQIIAANEIRLRMSWVTPPPKFGIFNILESVGLFV